LTVSDYFKVETATEKLFVISYDIKNDCLLMPSG